ncbi:MAG: LysE family translocator [Hyphomicrobiales bacterium]
MTYDLLISLFLFALISTCTPGPNNIMLLASGMNYGVLRTIPHMLGIGIGFPLMVFLVGIGASKVFDVVPNSYLVLKICCTLYFLYLAWRIATAGKPNTETLKIDNSQNKPLTFLEAVAFQWINPKAWTMALTAISLYTPSGQEIGNVAIVAGAFVFAAIFSTNIWATLGEKMRRIIHNDRSRKIFNYLCAFLLLASLYPILRG